VCLICFLNKIELLKQVIESLTPEHDWLLWFLVVRHSNGKTIFFSVLFEKKARVEEEDTPLPLSTKSTQTSSSDSLTHKTASQVLAVAASCSLSPGQPDTI